MTEDEWDMDYIEDDAEYVSHYAPYDEGEPSALEYFARQPVMLAGFAFMIMLFFIMI